MYYELEDKLVRLLMDFPPFPTSSSFPRARGSPGYHEFTSEVAQRSSDACHPYPTLYCFLCHGELAWNEHERIRALCEWADKVGVDGFVRQEFHLYVPVLLHVRSLLIIDRCGAQRSHVLPFLRWP